MSVNFRLKAMKIMDQRTGFYRQRIPESSNKTFDIDILVTSRNDGTKIMKSIRIMSRPTS